MCTELVINFALDAVYKDLCAAVLHEFYLLPIFLGTALVLHYFLYGLWCSSFQYCVEETFLSQDQQASEAWHFPNFAAFYCHVRSLFVTFFTHLVQPVIASRFHRYTSIHPSSAVVPWGVGCQEVYSCWILFCLDWCGVLFPFFFYFFCVSWSYFWDTNSQLYTVYSTMEQEITETLKIQIFTVILMATLNHLSLLNLLLSLYILV